MEVKIADGVIGKLEGGVVTVEALSGAIKLAIELGGLVVPALESVKAKIVAGEIDPIKGTEIDKEVMLKAIDALIAMLK